jgi:hypothetical protein
MLHQFLIQWDSGGNIQGAHLMAWDGVNPPSPRNVTELTPEELASCPEWASQLLDAIQKTGTAKEDLSRENLQLRKQLMALSPKLPLEDLLTAGLTSWADRAIANYNESHRDGADSLMPVVARLYSAGDANDLPQVLALFSEVLARSQIPPSPDEAAAMQAVLDAAFFPAELISFRPWVIEVPHPLEN